MSTGRDDFTQGTIRKVAGRVGYRCSFPGCNIITIGASMENTSKVSVTGVAAHICAAAKGGPRYNASMTSDERRGSDNCIWMCQTHSKLIDTDEKTYTVELLNKWKKDAEEEAAKALANPDYLSEYYRNNGNNLGVLTQLFDDMIMNGQYNQLKVMLQQYKTTLSEQYEEFILRYKVIYDTYCDREKLGVHLTEYCKLTCKSGVDVLAELFLSFYMIDELKVIKDFGIKESIKEYVSLVVAGELMEKMFVPVGTTMSMTIPKELEDTILKSATNYICKNKRVGILDTSGNIYKLYSEGFYYQVVSAAYEIGTKIIYENDEDSIFEGASFVFIRDNIDKILQLDISLQEYVMGQFLDALVDDYETFFKYYQKCSSELKEFASIQKAKFVCDMRHDVSFVNIKTLLEYAEKTGDESVVCLYLTYISKEEAKQFLDEHSFLYRKNSVYIRLKFELANDIEIKDAINFLEQYRTEYSEDFTFHCLMAKYSNGEQRMKEIEWLRGHIEELKIHDFMDYVHVLCGLKSWMDVIQLSQYNIPNEYVFQIAGCLLESGIDENIKYSKKLYQKLIDKGWERKGLLFDLGQAQWHLGYIEEAKKSLVYEYDKYKTIVALKYLVQMRYETHDYVMDVYFDKLKGCVDKQSQNMIGAIYLKNNIYGEARKYFLRSLLINDKDNGSINGFYMASSHVPKEEINTIKENTACILKNDKRTVCVAIHSADILVEIDSPCDFAEYVHYSVENEHVSSLLFSGKGDSVLFQEDTYIIEEIISVNDAIIKYFFHSLYTNENVMKVSSSSAEELINQITPMLKASSESMKKIMDDYNQQSMCYPITVLATITGKELLATCEFLAYGNSGKIENNLSLLEQYDTSTVFVLSYESIVFLLHMEIDLEALDNIKMICSPQVKNRLIDDINEELSSLSDNNHAGSMYFEEGKISMFERTGDYRRVRYTFLIKMKAFVNKICVSEDGLDFVLTNELSKNVLEEIFVKQKLFCERGSLGMTKKVPSRVLVTEDQFLSAVANTEGVTNTGLIGMLLCAKLDWKTLLNVSKKLKEMNFANYLPFQLYKTIVDVMLEKESDLESASREIQKWLVSDTDNSAYSYHEDVILSLCREVFSQELFYLNPNNILGRMGVNIIEKRNPGYIRECISKMFESQKDDFIEVSITD